MLCYVMLCYVMLCYVMLFHDMSYYVMLCYVTLRYVMSYSYAFLPQPSALFHFRLCDSTGNLLTNLMTSIHYIQCK